MSKSHLLMYIFWAVVIVIKLLFFIFPYEVSATGLIG